jgi:hypothetical protein
METGLGVRNAFLTSVRRVGAVTVYSHQKTARMPLNGGEEKISQSPSSPANHPVSFQFKSYRQMEASDMREYIRELETYIRTYHD